MQEQQTEINELWAVLGAVVIAASFALFLVRTRPRKLLPLVLFALTFLAAGSSYAACSSPTREAASASAVLLAKWP